MTEDGTAPARGSGTGVPSSALWLGAFGAIPFLCLAGATPFLSGPAKLLAAHALAAYGAVILSFLGGVHWGLAVGSEHGSRRGKLSARLAVSVIPSLVAWAGLLIGESMGLFILATAFAAMLLVDVRAARLGEAPPWYPRLRIPLSLIVIAALLVGAWTVAAGRA